MASNVHDPGFQGFVCVCLCAVVYVCASDAASRTQGVYVYMFAPDAVSRAQCVYVYTVADPEIYEEGFQFRARF